MKEIPLASIKQYLQREDVQKRIDQAIYSLHRQISVSIGIARDLTGLSENQLRKWEERKLLSPRREGSHRYYPLEELEKLVIINELLNAKFALSSIPLDVDTLYRELTEVLLTPDQIASGQKLAPNDIEELVNQPINRRIERAREDLFWRYYASHTLRIALKLIHENIPTTKKTVLGLILPLQVKHKVFEEVTQPDQLPLLGESLVGWLALSGSSHTLFTHVPSFENPHQYRVYQLRAMQGGNYQEDDGVRSEAIGHTLLITNWKLTDLSLDSVTIKAIRRLLAPLYEQGPYLRTCFGQGMRDVLDPATDLYSDYEDYILNGLTDMVVSIGGQAKKWHFCCILTPNDLSLPLQRRSLVVRAQSQDGMHEIGKTLVSPNSATISISLRAYQSGQVIYRPEISEEDITIALRDLENPASAIAVPIEGANDTSCAVLYVVSNRPNDFDGDDQRILHLVGRMVQEVLTLYNGRYQAAKELTNIIAYPEVIDPFFKKMEGKKILSEDQFIQDLEELLKRVQKNTAVEKDNMQNEGYEENGGEKKVRSSIEEELKSKEALSIISLDVDQQIPLANRYGDQFAQNLSKVTGSSLQRQLRRILTDAIEYTLYHACYGRFYLLLDGVSLEDARKHAERIIRRFSDDYEVSVLGHMDKSESITNPTSTQLVRVTLHASVSNYTYVKLEDLLQRYVASNAVGSVRALIDRDIDRGLRKGEIEGGNVVMTWNPDPQTRTFISWPPSNPK